MAIEFISEIDSYKVVGGLEDQLLSIKDSVNTKLSLSGGTITGDMTVNKYEPYVIQTNKRVPTRVFTDLDKTADSSGYKYTSSGLQFRAKDNSILSAIINECTHDSKTTSITVDKTTMFNYLQLPTSVYTSLTPNSNDSTVATRGIRLSAVLKANNHNPSCEATCSIPYRNSDAGGQIVVQSWIRKNLTGLDRIAPDSTILWYNNSTYNVRFDQDGDSYGSSKTRPWIGYYGGNLYLKEPFTNFNRLWIMFSEEGARHISTYFVDTYDLDLRMKSYFYPYGSSSPLFLGLKNGISTTESGYVTFSDLFHGFSNQYWNIYGYNTHSTVDAYKSTTSILKLYTANSRCLCIIGIGRKSQTTWNP